MKPTVYVHRVRITLPDGFRCDGNDVEFDVPEREPTLHGVADAAMELADPIERAMMLASIETVSDAMDARAVAKLLKLKRI